MDKKTVLVTGGNKGIGYEICRQLSELGFTIVLAARDEQKGADAVKKLSSDANAVHFLKIDVANENDIYRAAHDFHSKFGHLDILINNAGIFIDTTGMSDINPEIMRQTMEINFYGPLFMCKAFLPFLKRSSDARIINMSSQLGQIASLSGGYPAYRTSKASLNALTLILAAENPAMKINAMCPGWVATEMGGSGAPRTVAKGAETAIWLSTEPTILSGKFYHDKHVINW